MQPSQINPLQAFNERTTASLLGISVNNLRARRARRQVPYTRIGHRVLYTVAHIESILEAEQSSVAVTTTTRT